VNAQAPPGFNFSFAYQPIVDIEQQKVFAYEALVRGLQEESAGSCFAQIPSGDLHRFDRDARIRAIELAASLKLSTLLSLNFLPQSLETFPDAIESTIEAAHRANLALRSILLEVTEGEMIHDAANFAKRMNSYRAQGLRVAIDDFGAGYSGLNLLAEFQPDAIKLDMQLVRDIESKGPRQAIVRAVIQACDDLGIEVIAEGVESEAEFRWFKRIGVRLFQGYYFCRPGFRALPQPECCAISNPGEGRLDRT
jgi:EAL domain-containing protein (putative c-di-GMP-specific phosphodiesterase class I)